MRVGDIRKVFDLLAAIVPNFEDKYIDSDHDIIYFPVSSDDIPEDSELGRKLDEAGAHVSSDTNSWAMF